MHGSVECFSCGGGHFARDCPHAGSGKGDDGCVSGGGEHLSRDLLSNNGGSNIDRKRFACYTCGGGHIARDCTNCSTKGRGKMGRKGRVPSCFICSGGHIARECPDVGGMGPGKGAPLCDLLLVLATTLVVVPPLAQWKQFVDIKMAHLKKSIKRPPYPHISMLSRFVPPSEIENASKELHKVLRAVPPFALDVDELGVFPGSPNLMLHCKSTPSKSLEGLQATLAGAVPQSRYKFEAHIGLGHFGSEANAKAHQADLQKTWQPLRFEVRHVFVLQLQAPDEPWTVVGAIPLSGVPEDEAPELSLGSRTSLEEQEAAGALA